MLVKVVLIEGGILKPRELLIKLGELRVLVRVVLIGGGTLKPRDLWLLLERPESVCLGSSSISSISSWDFLSWSHHCETARIPRTIVTMKAKPPITHPITIPIAANLSKPPLVLPFAIDRGELSTDVGNTPLIVDDESGGISYARV